MHESSEDSVSTTLKNRRSLDDPPMHSRFTAILTALAAAALFGATTPIAKALLGPMPPFMVAGLFYLGSGVGLGAILLGRAFMRATTEGLRAREMAWLFGAIAFGGVA